jgi:1-acyl-sn-glycerol-3-phosphate acyltransferase
MPTETSNPLEPEGLGVCLAEAGDLPQKPARAASRLVLVAMNVWVLTATLAGTVIGITLSPLLFVIWLCVTRWPVGKIMRHFVWMYGRVWMWLVSPFVRVTLKGAKPAESGQPCIYVANHLSFFDIFMLSAMPVFDVVICLRSWPFKMAWYAPFMRLAQYVDVEQLSWDEILRQIQRNFDDGRSVLLFPQGHRSRNGRIGRFYSGAFKMAVRFGVPIVPICITGTDQLLPPGRRWVAPAEVQLECLDAIDPKAFQHELGHVELRKYVKKLMGACLARNQA